MMSKKLLSHSLFSVYKEFVYSEKEPKDEELKKEIWVLAQNPEVFTEKEIESNKEKLSKIEDVAKHKKFICHVDGALLARYEDRELKTGKNIKAGSSFVIESNNTTLIESYFRIPNVYKGKDTNTHIAEYQALISCLRVLSLYHPRPETIEVHLFSDSEVMTKQMNLEIRTRDIVRQELRQEAQSFIKQFKSVVIEYCPREQNQRADTLAKRSIEEKEWADSSVESVFKKEEIK